MRVSRQQAGENRNRVVETAARLFRERGFDGIGVSDVMKAAGLTHGGFYGQFASKQDLMAEAAAKALVDSHRTWSVLDGTEDGEAFDVLVDRYVSARHRDNPAAGCAIAALGTEVGRKSGIVRRSFEEGLERLVATLSRFAGGRTGKKRRESALADFAQMVGAIVLARAVEDQALSDEILASVRKDLHSRRGGRCSPPEVRPRKS